jgi:hypothetical protein
VNGFDAGFSSVHEHHQKEKQIQRQADDAETLFALIPR